MSPHPPTAAPTAPSPTRARQLRRYFRWLVAAGVLVLALLALLRPEFRTLALALAAILASLALYSYTSRRARQRVGEEQHRAGAALAESEHRLALALEASTDGLFDIDLATGAVYCSPGYFAMLGYEPGELVPSLDTWRQLLHPDDRPLAEAALDRYATAGASQHCIETRLRAKDGSWRWILSRGRIVAQAPTGAPLRLVGTHVDITERKQAELALRKAKDFAEKLIDTANALVVGLDTEGSIIVFNATAEAVTGYTAVELAGRNWFETLVPRDRYPQVWAEFERLRASGLPAHFENPILTRSGDERTVIWRNSVLYDQGRIEGTISFGIDVTDARRTEHALAKERDLVARLVETSPSGILVVDSAGLILFANHEAERILDIRRSDIAPHRYDAPQWELFNPDGSLVPEAERAFRCVLATGQPVHDIRHLLRWRSGRAVLLSINAAPLYTPGGEIEAVVSTLNDITDRQHSEDLLRENESRLRDIVDHAPFGAHLYELQPDGRLILQSANQPADSILHLDHHPLLGRDIADAFPSLRGTEIPAAYRRTVTEARPFHCPQLHYAAGQPGAIFDVHALPLGHNRVVVFFTDITERERAATALRHSEERYRHLFNAGNDAILVHGFQPDGSADRFVQVNDIACQIFGYPRETLLTLALSDIVPSDLLHRATAAAVRIRTEHHALFELEFLASDGRRIPVEINSSLVELDGRPLCLCIVRDVTERRHLEDQLRQSQKLEVFGQLAGGVAHDFNNLLVAIIGNSELLLDSTTLDERQREQTTQIQEAARRAAALTRQLLLFARKQPAQPIPCDLGTIVSEHAKLLRRLIGENIALQLELATVPLPIVADVNMVEQVAMNLVVNARDSMPRGGTLVLRTARVTLAGTEAVRASCPPGAYAALFVRDTGCGIPAADRQRIFEPFFTTKPAGQGTGLGLSTVLGIIQQHHGGIALESEEGRGSQFAIYLPLATAFAAAPAPPGPGAQAEIHPVAPTTILVVEDDDSVRTIIDRTLSKAGYRVLLATCAAEGLEQLEHCAEHIDLVLSDIVMPGEIDGAQLAEIAATRWPTSPVLLMSGYAKDLDHIAATILRKPFTTAQLLGYIHDGLAAHPLVH